MAFGQPSGLPASRRQLDELLALVQRAGYADFREARHPLGFTQRQANGKFTRDEADGFIEMLFDPDSDPDGEADSASLSEGQVASGGPSAAGATQPAVAATAGPITAVQTRKVRDVPSSVLAAELQRRGWVVMEP